MKSHPGLWVIAGPNGAGKSTLVQRYKLYRRLKIINPDEIAARIASFTKDYGPATQLQAGRLALKERLRSLQQRETFAIETTLSGHTELKFMKKAKDLGYKINVMFVSIYNFAQSDSRVAERVKRGGHDVPEEDIYRRFNRIGENLTKVAKIAHRLQVFDNSGDQYKLAFSMSNGKYRVLLEMPEWVTTSLQNALFQQQEIQITTEHYEDEDDYYPSPGF